EVPALVETPAAAEPVPVPVLEESVSEEPPVAAEVPPPVPLVLEACTGLTLAPGETAVLTPELLRITGGASPFLSDIVLLSPPEQGVLLRDGFVLMSGDVFTQEDIDHGRMHYRHDGNLTAAADRFTFGTPSGEIPPHEFPVELLPVRRAPELAGCGQ